MSKKPASRRPASPQKPKRLTLSKQTLKDLTPKNSTEVRGGGTNEGRPGQSRFAAC